MPAPLMTLRSSSKRIALPSRRRWPQIWLGALLVAAVCTSYLVGYLSVRTGHRVQDGQWVISTGSRMSNWIFAPVIYAEQTAYDKPDPRLTFESVLAESRSSRRPVLIVLGTTHCLPCRQAEEFLEQQRAVLSKYFVVVKADLGEAHTLGVLVRDKYRKQVNTDGYIEYFPWLACVDGQGQVLVTGDDRGKGLIGLPQGGPQDRKWFLQMLQIANPKISDVEITSLDDAAAAYHRHIWNSVK